MNVFQDQEVMEIYAIAFPLREFWQFIEILEEAQIIDSSILKLLYQLSQIIKSLLSHDGVISFVSDFRRIVINQIRNS